MRLLLFMAFLVCPLNWLLCQDSTLLVRVEFSEGGGEATYIFTPEGTLIKSFLTGGPTWRKDTVVREIFSPNPDFTLEVVTQHNRNGEQSLLLERTVRKLGRQLTVTVVSYHPVLEVSGFRAIYRLDEHQRIVRAQITEDPPGLSSYPDSTAVFNYSYGAAGRCEVIDSFSQAVVLDIIPHRKRTDVRMMERRNKGYTYVFGLDGLLKSKTFRDGGAGRQTEYHRGKKGLRVSGMSFSLSVSGGPAPRALWRSAPIAREDLADEVNQRMVRALLESLAFANTTYRKYFPAGYSPAERWRE